MTERSITMTTRIGQKIKVQRQGAISMTIPMFIVKALGISVGEYLNVEYDQDTNSMVVTKWKE